MSTLEIVESTRPMSDEIASAVGDYDHEVVEAQVQEIMNPATSPKICEITPQQAAHIYNFHNAYNRDISGHKVTEYKRAMERGEWMMNHQGMAFYDNNNLADGQHRCAAIALSRIPQNVMVMAGFQREAIQTIDLGKARNAGEALKMDGVTDGAAKSIAQGWAAKYHHLVEHGNAPRYSQIQLVAMVKKHDTAWTSCFNKADFLNAAVTDSPMKRNDIALQLFIMVQYGNFTMDRAAEFIGSVLTGVAPYEGAPQLVLSRQLTRAKHSAKTSDRLAGINRIAIIQKAAKIWADGQKCSALKWSKKEGYPLAVADPQAGAQVG